jgi:hypothetical protein
MDIYDLTPAITIINSDKGVVDEETGIWYSNSSYRPYVQKPIYKKCDHCKKSPLIAKIEKDEGLCVTCLSNQCESCGEIHTPSELIVVKHGGITTTYCTECLNIHDPIFLGGFKKDEGDFSIGREWTPSFSHSIYDSFKIKKVEDGYVTITRRCVETEKLLGTLIYTKDRFLKTFSKLEVHNG